MKKHTIFVPCLSCKGQVQVEVHEVQIVNYQSFSVLVLEHPKTAVCACGATVVAQVAGLKGGFAFVAQMVPSDASENRIIPATHIPPV